MPASTSNNMICAMQTNTIEIPWLFFIFSIINEMDCEPEAGTVVGGAIGVLPALFTFGLSIPVGAAIGGGAGTRCR